MKFVALVFFTVGHTFLAAAEPTDLRNPQPRMQAAANDAPHAWLGLQVAKPDEMLIAQIPSLPRGIGFVVKSLNSGGPAQAAGLLEFDLLWKIGDQMLANEAQLATLLRLNRPGDEIAISGFRGGKPISFKLKLGLAPIFKKPFPGSLVESAILPGAYNCPMRVVNVTDKIVSYKADDGQAQVNRDGQIYKIQIHDSNALLIYDGELSKEVSLDTIPPNWRQRIQVLCRTLDQALDGGILPQRQPRPRVIPPPTDQP